MATTSISWTERTWNPITGCTKISEGCRHCYAEVMARRLQGMGQERYRNGFKLTMHPEALDEPMKVKQPSMFFVCSMADIFHKDIPFEFVNDIMMYIEMCPQHTFQILTKRANLMHQYFTSKGYVPSNVWIGVTVENEQAKERIWYLNDIKQTCEAKVTFLSCEPLLGDLGVLDLGCIDWVICGGESGTQARIMRKEWVLNIQQQCREQNIPFHFKQWGTYGEDGVRRNKKMNGCTIDGIVYQEFPQEWNRIPRNKFNS